MDGLTLRHCQVPPDHYDREIKHNFLLRIWHQNRCSRADKILDGHQPRQILDIGCHGGMMTEKIGKKFPGAQVFGIDISSQAIEYAKKLRPQISFQAGEATKLPFKDESFDLVTCFDILEHIPNPGKALAEMNRVLTKSGQILIEIPTENSLFKTVWFFWTRFGSGRVWQETHVQDFRDGQLERLLTKSGFNLEKKEKINLGMLLLLKAGKG